AVPLELDPAIHRRERLVRFGELWIALQGGPSFSLGTLTPRSDLRRRRAAEIHQGAAERYSGLRRSVARIEFQYVFERRDRCTHTLCSVASQLRSPPQILFVRGGVHGVATKQPVALCR